MTQALPHETSLSIDLPPRTWRGWWLARPKWFRIGAYAFAGLAVLNIALVVRIYVGLQEPAEMTAMRKRFIEFRFFWQTRDKWEDFQFTAPEHLSWDQKILSGLYGHSWRNVEEVDLSHFGTDGDLKILTAHCPSLRFVTARSTDITSSAAATLKNCRQLSELDLSDTDVDDAGIIELRHLKQLSLLKLRETLVGDDAVYHALIDMQSLKGVDLYDSDVTFNSLEEWSEVRRVIPVIDINKEGFYGQRMIQISVRWADGTRSGRFRGTEAEIRVLGPPHHRSMFFSTFNTGIGSRGDGFSRHDLYFRSFGMGRMPDPTEYRVALRIGDIESKVITINESSAPQRIEFEMPCTKAEALASAKE